MRAHLPRRLCAAAALDVGRVQLLLAQEARRPRAGLLQALGDGATRLGPRLVHVAVLVALIHRQRQRVERVARRPDVRGQRAAAPQ